MRGFEKTELIRWRDALDLMSPWRPCDDFERGGAAGEMVRPPRRAVAGGRLTDRPGTQTPQGRWRRRATTRGPCFCDPTPLGGICAARPRSDTRPRRPFCRGHGWEERAAAQGDRAGAFEFAELLWKGRDGYSAPASARRSCTCWRRSSATHRRSLSVASAVGRGVGVGQDAGAKEAAPQAQDQEAQEGQAHRADPAQRAGRRKDEKVRPACATNVRAAEFN